VSLPSPIVIEHDKGNDYVTINNNPTPSEKTIFNALVAEAETVIARANE